MNKYIAVCGIWIGVGICSFGSPETTPIVATAAAFATLAVMAWD